MALIVCPECNQQMSDTAGLCPHCGYKVPINKKIKHPLDWILHALVTVAFSVLLIFANFCGYIYDAGNYLTRRTNFYSGTFLTHLNWRIQIPYIAYILQYGIIFLLLVALVLNYLKTKKALAKPTKTNTLNRVSLILVSVALAVFLASTFINMDGYHDGTYGPVYFLELMFEAYAEMALLVILVVLNFLNMKSIYLLDFGKNRSQRTRKNAKSEGL